ncbi:sensor histidine kinase [Paracoccus aminophilus]|uniref:Integral membrane sensor signal transduction histidine kinase n=1 Tax=Paracoccus aminophilus JCM 7686 TaxID=1367847 RepID=S5XSX4_PARAH|nr:histidine kinase [Paracoccus aminophilus]AGT08242.1 integral membrane sensor signal transduction histidine kinase [Paracoccus aminophilus JCM 7686]
MQSGAAETATGAEAARAPAPWQKPGTTADHAPRPAANHKASLTLIAFLGSLLAGMIVCAIVGAIVIVNARSSVRTETDSAFHLATAAATFRLPTAFQREDMLAQASRLATEIDALRHVSAWVDDTRGRRIAPEDTAKPDGPSPPAWLTALLTPPPQSDIFPIRKYPNVIGILTITTDPSDEIAKTWETLRIALPLLALAITVMVAVTMMVSLFISRRLRLVEGAMARMRDNDLAVRAPDSGLRELAALSEGVNALASHLVAGRAENRHLQERMLTLAESERALIASDLHDEMGPQLFALRAAVGQAEAAAGKLPPAESAQLAEALAAIARHAGEVQKTARAAIEDLRPMTLDDANLEELLHELAFNFSEMAPDIEITLDADPRAAAGEAAEIAIFRFVRESVLNAIRHANPSRIHVRMELAPGEIVTVVSDNGSGPKGNRAGLGRSGMEDRALILGAVYTAPYRRNDLTLTELRMPL